MKYAGLWILLAVVIIAAAWYFFINKGETYSTINNTNSTIDQNGLSGNVAPAPNPIEDLEPGEINPETGDPVAEDDPAFDDPEAEPEDASPIAPAPDPGADIIVEPAPTNP